MAIDEKATREKQSSKLLAQGATAKGIKTDLKLTSKGRNAKANAVTSSSTEERDLSKLKCFNCGEYGHFSRNCPKPDKRLAKSGDQRNNANYDRRRGKKKSSARANAASGSTSSTNAEALLDHGCYVRTVQYEDDVSASEYSVSDDDDAYSWTVIPKSKPTVITESSYALESRIYDRIRQETETFRETFQSDLLVELLTAPSAPSASTPVLSSTESIASEDTWSLCTAPVPRIQHVQRSSCNELFTCLHLQTKHLTDFCNFPSFITNHQIIPGKGFQGYRILSIPCRVYNQSNVQDQMNLILQQGIIRALNYLDLKLLSNVAIKDYEVCYKNQLKQSKWSTFLQDFVDCFNFIVQTTSCNRAIDVDLMWDNVIRISFHPNVKNNDATNNISDWAFAAQMLPEELQREIASLVIQRNVPDPNFNNRNDPDKYVTLSFDIKKTLHKEFERKLELLSP
jgi:hypothetical protein